MNEIMQVNVQVNQAGPTSSEGISSEHRVVMDRPEAKGGENKGPLGGETFLMALGGCFMSNLLAAAKTRDVNVANVKLDIRGTVGSVPARYTAVEVTITADYRDRKQMEKVMTIAERGCIVANTLKEAVDLSIRIG